MSSIHPYKVRCPRSSDYHRIFDGSIPCCFPVSRCEYLVEYIPEYTSIGCMSHSYESKCQYSEKSNSENQCPSEFFTNKLGKWCFLHIIRINDTIEYMKKLRNLKHIFVIILISLTILFGYIMIFADEFNDGINGYFIYRTSNGTWQDIIHKHTLRPSASDIVIIKIDERTLNGIQNNENDLKNLALTKKTYSDLIKNLE